MSTDTERHLVRLEARVSQFEKNFQKANRTANREFTGIERRAKQSADRLESSMEKASAGVSKQLKGMATAFAGGFIAGGLAGLIGQAGDAVKAIAQIGDEAKRAGMSTRAFQEWGYVAKQNRVGIDALVDGFKELNLRADEFISTGKGSAAEAFERLGYSAQSLKEKLKDPSALMLEIFGKMQNFDTAAQIRIFDELLGGTGGEQFVQLIAQGEDGLRRTIDRAHEVGAVMDDEMIQKAQDLDRRWNDLATSLGYTAKSAILGIASIAGAGIDAVNAMRDAIDETPTVDQAAQELTGSPDVTVRGQEDLRSFDELAHAQAMLQQDAPALVGTLRMIVDALDAVGDAEAAQAIDDILARLDDLTDRANRGEVSAADLRAELIELGTEAETALARIDSIDTITLEGARGQVSGLIGLLNAAANAAANLMSKLPGGTDTGTPLQGGAAANMPPTFNSGMTSSPRPGARPESWVADMDGDGIPDAIQDSPKSKGGGGGGGKSGGGGAAKERESQYQRETSRIREQIAALEVEAQARASATGSIEEQEAAVEKAKIAHDLLTAAQESGMTITPQLRAEAQALASSYLAAEDAARKLAEAAQETADQQAQVKDAFRGAFTGAVTGANTLLGALDQLISKLMEMAANKLFENLWGSVGGGITGAVGGMLDFSSGDIPGPVASTNPRGLSMPVNLS
ncbi:hypothetical protein [Paracoccus sp. IB05]|uniref:hypothetical protein n=1 Tax=Paracoccus sp. IB05 TaxID=2779367 RepID=UPI0018E8B55C|nr:hypothetical protein [Paracoccus sp. IB05]MBJ2151575.1 hypothetical protein [Paracoccus sp. IB05]